LDLEGGNVNLSIQLSMVEDIDDTKLVSHNVKRPRTVIAPKEKHELENF